MKDMQKLLIEKKIEELIEGSPAKCEITVKISILDNNLWGLSAVVETPFDPDEILF